MIVVVVGLILSGLVYAIASVIYLPLAFALPAVAALAFLSLVRPKAAMILTILIIPFERILGIFPAESYTEGGALAMITVPKIMLAVIIPLWLCRTLVLKSESVFRNTLSTPMPLLALILVFFTFLSLLNAQSLAPFAKFEVQIISNVGLFILTLNILDDKRSIFAVVKLLCISYFIVGAMGVFEMTTKIHVLELLGRELADEPYAVYDEAFRPTGPSGDPDYFAASVLFGFMLALGAWRLVRSWLIRSMLLVLLGILLFDIFATGSRGAALSFVIAMTAFFWFVKMPYKKLAAVALIVGGLTGFALYSATISPRSAARYTGGETKSLDYRVGWMKQCWEMIRENPFLGVGAGHFVVVQHQYFEPLVPRKPYHAANTYLQLAAESGIPALMVYLLLFSLVLLYLMRAFRRDLNSDAGHVSLCLFCGLLAFLAFAATASSLFVEMTWLLAGLSVSLARFSLTGGTDQVTGSEPPPVSGYALARS